MRRPTIALLVSSLLIAGAVPVVTAESPSPGPVSGRAEMPELGVTVTFPEDWELDIRLEPDQAPAELGPDAMQWRILDADGPEGSDDTCTVMLYRPTELIPTEFFERLRTDEGPDAPGVETLDTGFYRLAGPATVLGDEVHMAFYLVEANDTLALLWCMSETAPADDWLPIALSLQLQPVDDPDRERIAADLPVIDGSTSTQPLRMFIVCAVLDVPCDWVEWFDGSRAVVPTEGSSFEPFDAAVPTNGTHGSYVALAEGRADLILTARTPTDDEVRLAESNGVGFEITPIALDAFVFLVNAANPVEGLDLDQVRDVFSGAITDWAELGGDARPIQPYQRNETSGSQVLMERLVMAGTPMIDAPDMMLLTMMAPFDAISHDPDGIGYSVYYFATQMLATDEIHLLAIEGSVPNPTTIASGEYPLVTEVYAVLPSGSPEDSTARMLRDLLLSDAGRSIIEESGYVPLPR